MCQLFLPRGGLLGSNALASLLSVAKECSFQTCRPWKWGGFVKVGRVKWTKVVKDSGAKAE